MADDFYPSMDDASQSQAMDDGPEAQAPEETTDDTKDMGETALLPASFFGHDPEVGDECTIKVVKKYGDDTPEIEVSYVSSHKEMGEKEPDADDAGGATEAFDKMSESYKS